MDILIQAAPILLVCLFAGFVTGLCISLKAENKELKLEVEDLESKLEDYKEKS